ncbi:MAG TPA: hypothetical protein VMV68_07570, partial [Spirochaetia bacterium]|nr:hypothetical protein [Spirochaetia bacterium]
QRFQIQKKSPKLILAVKKEHFLYLGSERIDSFGEARIAYNSLIRNCLFNCDYCFLQGMHPSAFALIYVNGEDFFPPVDEALAQGPLAVSISYVTDLLGFEGVLPLCRRWIEFARGRTGLTVEIRTKSDNYTAIRDIEPTPNVALTWTMSPEPLAARYERGTASFKNRLFALRCALDDGWRVRICFDPLLHIEGWQELYASCIDEIACRVDLNRVERWSLGTLRMPAGYLKRITHDRQDSDILYAPFVVRHGDAAYPDEWDREMKETVSAHLRRYVDERRITLVG